MSLKNQLKATLAGISAGARVISLTDEDNHFTCEITDANPLACEIRKLQLRTDALAEASIDRLKAISDALTKRVTYLLEPVGPVELDREQCVVQMRSNPPQKDDDGTSYYELLVRRGGELALCRYKKERGGVRQVVPAVITREVLLRLVGDFEAVLA